MREHQLALKKYEKMKTLFSTEIIADHFPTLAKFVSVVAWSLFYKKYGAKYNRLLEMVRNIKL